MVKNIVLTGFMMAGKTSVSIELSELCNRALVDTDEEIIKQEGYSINEIFNRHGEEYFRKLESEVIARLSEKEGIIISTGGGAVLNKQNIENLRKKGVIVNIKITPEVIGKRFEAEKVSRPLIKSDELSGVLKRLADRESFYADCDYQILASNTKTPREQAEEIIKILKENGEI